MRRRRRNPNNNNADSTNFNAQPLNSLRQRIRRPRVYTSCCFCCFHPAMMIDECESASAYHQTDLASAKQENALATIALFAQLKWTAPSSSGGVSEGGESGSETAGQGDIIDFFLLLRLCIALR